MSDTPTQPSEATESQIVVIDGSRYDAETGEFLGFVHREAFAVNDRESAEWVLSKMLQAEAELAAIASSPEVLRAKAILANAERMGKEHQARLDSLHRRFDQEIAEFARKELEGKKGRTLKTLFGTISLKTVKGGLRVVDKESALAWARTNAPGAIKTTEAFQISALTDEERAAAVEGLADDAPAEGYAFEVAPDRETVAIKTGVEA